LGIGDWGFGDWGLGPIPNPQIIIIWLLIYKITIFKNKTNIKNLFNFWIK